MGYSVIIPEYTSIGFEIESRLARFVYPAKE